MALAILPDHVHLLLVLGRYNTSSVMHAIKGSMSRKVNLLAMEERFTWQRSFRDHLVRNEDDYRERLAYIMNNPEHHQAEGFVWAAPLSLSAVEEERHDRVVALVEDMLSLHKKLAPPGRGTDHPARAGKDR